MRITLSVINPEVAGNDGNDDADLLSLEVYPEMTLETLRGAIRAETSFELNRLHLYHNGQLLTDNSKTMEQLQVMDGDVLALHVSPASEGNVRPANQPPQQTQRQIDPELLRLQLLGSPELQERVRASNPELLRLLDQPAQFAQAIMMSADREHQERLNRQREIARLNEDPLDVEAQRKIEEMIRAERVTENMQSALEHNPEAFGRVHMLYVDVEVNGHKVKALVDSGAQATIMSPACAEACGIMRLIDKRFAGVARGVGTAQILGRVHWSQIKIGDLFLMCSFTVMEGKAVDLLLGLDMLKRHQATIDLGRDKLIIQGHEVPFLGEADIPKETEEALDVDPHASGGVVAPTTEGAATAATAAAGPSGTQPVAPAQSMTAQSGTPIARPAPGTPARAQQAAPARPSFPREHIDQLMAFGATEERAIRLLEATGGNLEFAAGMIFEED